MILSVIAYRLTCLFCLLSWVLGLLGLFEGVLAGAAAGCFPLVPGSFVAAGAGAGGFRRAGGGACLIAGAAEPGADPGGGHLAGRLAGLPEGAGGRGTGAGGGAVGGG